MFNLEKEISKWKKSLRKNPSLEDGYIEELESHLWDVIDEHVEMGISLEGSFNYAVEQIGKSHQLGNQFYNAYSKGFNNRPPWQTPKWMPSLLWNYIKTAVRIIRTRKTFSFINIAGLSLGMVCFILISLLIWDEVSYDNYHVNIDRLYRVNTITPSQDKINPNSSLRLGKELKSKYPGIEAHTNLVAWGRSLVRYESKTFDEQGIYLVDSDFFKMFSFNFIEGNPYEVLKDKYSIVITEETAKKYFGEENALGKKVYSAAYERDFFVSAVIQNLPKNSTLKFNIAANVELMPQQRKESWEFTGYTFVMIDSNVSNEEANSKLFNFYRENVDPDTELSLQLQEFSTLHLYQHGKPGLIKVVYLSGSIAVFILIIAFINFMNLSTAKAAKRAKEVIIKKVNGANNFQLIFQFISESIFMAFLSLILALIIVWFALPYFNAFTMKDIDLFGPMYKSYLAGAILLAIISGLISGSYPAFVLSSFKPASVIKGNYSKGKAGFLFRKILITGQFAISIGLIICTVIIIQQLTYIQTKEIGLDRAQILIVNNNPELNSKFDSYKNELLKNNSVKSVSASATLPFDVGQSIGINWERSNIDELQEVKYTVVDYDYFSTMGIQILKGRPFSKTSAYDSSESCLINETLLSMMSFDDPIGKKLYFGHPAFPEEKRHLKIIGVVKDFHSQSLRNRIKPFVFNMKRDWNNYVFVKLQPGVFKNTIEGIKKVTKSFAGSYTYTFDFLDGAYDDLYVAEIKMGQIVYVLAGVAVLISCLGLFGMASFTAEQKIKEIGIRKVLGANVTDMFKLLSMEFIKWIIYANLLAWPLAYYVMNKWLQDFAFKIEIEYWVFILSGILALSIAIITISYTLFKTTYTNPVEALKYE